METVKKKFDKALYDVADKKAKEVMMVGQKRIQTQQTLP